MTANESIEALHNEALAQYPIGGTATAIVSGNELLSYVEAQAAETRSGRMTVRFYRIGFGPGRSIISRAELARELARPGTVIMPEWTLVG